MPERRSMLVCDDKIFCPASGEFGDEAVYMYAYECLYWQRRLRKKGIITQIITQRK